jgi:hypothetical protein
MALSFPNVSRSWDATRRAVRFWGYDGALEFSFFVEESALSRTAPGSTHEEAALLKIFDANRERIFKAASAAYARRRKGSYTLIVSDF